MPVALIQFVPKGKGYLIEEADRRNLGILPRILAIPIPHIPTSFAKTINQDHQLSFVNLGYKSIRVQRGACL